VTDVPLQFAIGIDWSGAASAAAQRRAIWTARVKDGVLVSLTDGFTRAEAIAALTRHITAHPETVVGLDFSFSLPRWWLDRQQLRSARELWLWAAARGDGDWLRELGEPFWGVRFRPKPPADGPELRRTEQQSTTDGARPMSTFRLFGPGTVGAQALRGHPHLVTLEAAGCAIWPFVPARRPLVMEVFPRLLVRQLAPDLCNVTGRALREALVRRLPDGFCGPGRSFAALLRDNHDAFDAAVTAWALWSARASLPSAADPRDPVDLMEGRIWRLPDAGPRAD
jgi:hypothetical protein